MKVSTSIDVDAPAEHVWQIIGPGFGQVGDWASAIPESRLTRDSGPEAAVGDGRVCTLATAAFDELTEELTEYDPGVRRLTYRAVQGMPSFVTEAANTWHVLPRPDGGSTFTMRAEVGVAGPGWLAAPFLRLYLARIGRRTGLDLKVYAETGAVSRAKAAETLRRARANGPRSPS